MGHRVETNADTKHNLSLELAVEIQYVKETRPAFLGRLAGIALGHPYEELQAVDFRWFSHHIPAWRLSDKVTSDRSRYVLAERDFEETETNPLRTGAERSRDGRLLRVIAGSKLTVLARTALLGSDLAGIFSWEASIEQVKLSKGISPAAPTLVAKPEKVQPPLKLTRRERNVLRLSALIPSEIADKLRVRDVSSVSTNLQNAQKNNNVSRQELVVRAFDEKIIELGTLPAKRPVKLTVSELEVLRSYMFMSAKGAAGPSGFSDRIILQDRLSIREKLGVETETQAFLMALRDGLLDLNP